MKDIYYKNKTINIEKNTNIKLKKLFSGIEKEYLKVSGQYL